MRLTTIFSALKRLPKTWRGPALRLSFNLHPAFRATGGRVQFVSNDLRHLRIRLPLIRQTRNLVGSIFGGSLFSITDGVHVTLLFLNLSDDLIIWDKSANIRYRKPAYDTVYADFTLSETDLDHIQQQLALKHELDHRFTIQIKDDAGFVHTQVERTLYIAQKAFYKQKYVAKASAKTNPSSSAR